MVLWCLLPASLAAAPNILVLGDSLSAAYGIPQSEGWVALLAQRLENEGYPHRVVNKSISGETTAGGLVRLPAALEDHRPALTLIELGANDGLRAQSLDMMRQRLRRMVQLAQAAGSRVLLFEMRIPSNFGPRYTEGFHGSFARVAESTGAALVPFFLAEIALEEQWFQEDGIHPTAAAQPRLLEAVWPHVAAALSDPPVRAAAEP